MAKRTIDSNARKALDELKLEIANELGVSDDFTNKDESNPVTNIFDSGRVGGLMTRKLVETGEKDLMDDE
ncbi:small, acid-soluble spore protein, alpha/beta type [Schnuerera sp. xch1]|uniref:small, acid-soluble spore protein, alpha/beta type n=1 Tax=Schnuerera sp. xch1 TaxID=2874283 RepID=UPI001CBBB070|nr:alpha/beta-type small acid-soluble spore protein [Schnuerera sp. xch1]